MRITLLLATGALGVAFAIVIALTVAVAKGGVVFVDEGHWVGP